MYVLCHTFLINEFVLLNLTPIQIFHQNTYKMKIKILYFIICALVSSTLFAIDNGWRTKDGGVSSDHAKLNVQLGAWYKGKWDSKLEPQICISGLRWGTETTSLQSNDLIIGQLASTGATNAEIVFESSFFKEGNKMCSFIGKISTGVQLVGLGRRPHCSDCPWCPHWTKGTTLNSRDLRSTDLCMFYVAFPRDQKFSAFKVKDVLIDGNSVPYIIKFNTQPSLTRVGSKVPFPPKVRFHKASISKTKQEVAQEETNQQESNQAKILNNQIDVGIHIPAGPYDGQSIQVAIKDDSIAIIANSDKPIYINKKPYSKFDAQNVLFSELKTTISANPKISFKSCPRGSVSGKNFVQTKKFAILPNAKSSSANMDACWYHFVITFE